MIKLKSYSLPIRLRSGPSPSTIYHLPSTTTNRGFTIVELLVVIVVIGILAALTIISYTGISRRAIEASLKSDLTNASQQLKIYQVINSAYPTSLDVNNCFVPASDNMCLKPSSGNSYSSYTANNSSTPQTFSLDATNGTTTYRITNDSTPVIVATITTPVDLMEYSTDAIAQAAYVNDGSLGSELVLNGAAWTGAAGTTPPNNWTNNNPGKSDTFTIESGTLKLTTVNSQVIMYQVIPVVIGQSYKVSVDFKNGNLTDGIVANFGTTGGSYGGSEYLSFNQTGTSFTTYSGTFIATGTTLYVYIHNAAQSGNQYGWVDNLSVKIIPILSFSEPTIKQQGSYALKGIAAITTSLNKTLTRTVSPTINMSSQNIIKFDIRSSRTGTNLQAQIHDSGGTTSTHNINITSADTWQTETWDISGISSTDKDVIDQIIFKVINADAANTFYIDNIVSTD